MNKNIKNIAIFFLMLVLLLGIFSFFDASNKKTTEISVAKLVSQINADQVKNITVTGSKLDITLKDDTVATTRKEANEPLSDMLKNYGVSSEKIAAIDITVKDESGEGAWWMTLLPYLLPLVIIIAVVWFMMRQVQGVNNRAMSFGQSGAKMATQNNKVNFGDVAGAYETDALDRICHCYVWRRESALRYLRRDHAVGAASQNLSTSGWSFWRRP